MWTLVKIGLDGLLCRSGSVCANPNPLRLLGRHCKADFVAERAPENTQRHDPCKWAPSPTKKADEHKAPSDTSSQSELPKHRGGGQARERAADAHRP